ncbi:interleukin-31 receptor subunit alpha [Tiliqua scincoides]|uniref:interleukin-31 receptor subunit alpha n=1 Tax=Tiliqua scincoides TaxID=71010 RepID=UPI0034633440
MVLNEMLYSLIWILTILDRIDLADEDAVAYPRIFPSSPVIERGSTLEVFCSLGKKLYPYKNASDIIWTLNDAIVKENYIIINESVSGVIIRNFTYGKACVKCFVDSPSEKQHMAHAEVKTGFPPQAPENISCIFYYTKNFTCNWTTTRETDIETDYTLFKTHRIKMEVKNQNENVPVHVINTSVCDIFQPQYLVATFEKEIRLGFNSTQAVRPDMPENVICFYSCGRSICEWTARNVVYLSTGYRKIVLQDQDLTHALKHYTCSSKNGSCSLYEPQITEHFDNYCVQVKANNSLGEVKSECIRHGPREVIKFDPPRITKIETIPGIKQMLTVTWERCPDSFGPLNCQIRYEAPTKHHLREVNDDMGDNVRMKSINLTNLWDLTNYTVELRCAHKESRFWSEWSANKTGITEEQAPMKVDLWRVIESHQPTGNRIVHLLWKKCEEFPSSGIIVDYQIKYSTENNHSSETTSNETMTCNLTGEAYQISVIARNAAGESPEAILRIPSIREERKDQRIVLLNASALPEEMVVEWETTCSNITDYVIEWYDELEKDIYKRSWQYVRNVTKWTSPKRAFEAFKCYNISVYPLYKGEIESPSSVRIYFHEKRPSKGPDARVENLGKHEVTITWKEVEKAEANGDIVNYTVFYKPEGGEELGETVNASVLQHQLKSLQAKTTYLVHVMASTRAGGTSGKPIKFITTGLSIIESILINIVVGIFMLFLLTVGSLWALKKYRLKNICWPKIPHPTVSDCSDASRKIMLRVPPSEQDTESPDCISILKVDAPSENDGNDEVQLPDLENDFSQPDVTMRDVVGRHQMLCSTELEDIKPLPQAIPSIGQDQGQTNWKESNEFNPYLKNSVHTREFLLCENSNQNTKESKNSTNHLATCMPNDTGQPYVALNTFELFLKHE